MAMFLMFAVSHVSPCRGPNVCLSRAIFQMFTIGTCPLKGLIICSVDIFMLDIFMHVDRYIDDILMHLDR